MTRTHLPLTSEDELNGSDYSMLIESMQYTQQSFENYAGYPSYEFRLQRINEAKELIRKLRNLRKGYKLEEV